MENVIIYMRRISLEVIIPGCEVWDFMREFGTKFPVRDLHEGTQNIRAVDYYFEHPAGWHIRLTISEHEEGLFYSFLSEFCERRRLTFRDPRVKSPGTGRC